MTNFRCMVLGLAVRVCVCVCERSHSELCMQNYGMMASIGKRTGIGNLLGVQVQGFLAWWIWRNYYLVNLPTLQKKVRVLADWVLDIFFKRDVTMLKTFAEEKKIRKTSMETEVSIVVLLPSLTLAYHNIECPKILILERILRFLDVLQIIASLEVQCIMT
jgi:hypothetical protein